MEPAVSRRRRKWLGPERARNWGGRCARHVCKGSKKYTPPLLSLSLTHTPPISTTRPPPAELDRSWHPTIAESGNEEEDDEEKEEDEVVVMSGRDRRVGEEMLPGGEKMGGRKGGGEEERRLAEERTERWKEVVVWLSSNHGLGSAVKKMFNECGPAGQGGRVEVGRFLDGLQVRGRKR